MSKSDLTALSPEFFSSARDIVDLEFDFGPSENRYLARLPEDWIKAAEIHLTDLSLNPVEASHIRVFLHSKARTFFSHARYKSSPNTRWEDNVASIEAAGSKFAFVIGGFIDPQPYDNWSNNLLSVKQSRKRSGQFSSSPSSLVSLVENLARISPELVFIDPWFSPDLDCNRELIERLLSTINSTHCFRLHFIFRCPTIRHQSKSSRGEEAAPEITKSKKDNQFLADELEHTLRDRFLSLLHDRELHFYLVDDRPVRPSLKNGLTNTNRRFFKVDNHDRFILSPLGGFMFGRSFNLERESAQKINWALLDNDHRKRLYAEMYDLVIRFSEQGAPCNSNSRFRSVNRISLKSR